MKNALYITILSFFLLLNVSYAQRELEGLKRGALKHMQNGRYGDAIDLLNKYVSMAPRNPEGYYLRGLCFENRKQYFNAVIDYRRALKLNRSYTAARKALSRTIEVWYAVLLREIEGYKREIAISPRNPFNYLEIGRRYRWMEEWELAEKWYDKYLARDKNASPDEIIRYTIILTKTGHIKKGEKILKTYVQRYPDDWRLWSRYGYFSLWLGKNKTAEKAFLKALSFKPFFQEALDGLDLARREGYVTLYQQNYDRVKRREYPIDRDYRILWKNPENDDVRFRLVEELMKAKRYEEAYQQLLILKDKHQEEAYFNTLWEEVVNARTTYYKEKIAEAMDVLQQDSLNPKATREVAQYYSNLEAYPEAEEILAKYLQNNPHDYETRYVYAHVLALDGKYHEALAQMDTVLTYNSERPKYLLLAGQLNVWMNQNLDLAKEYLTKVLTVEPKNEYALVALGTLYFQKDSLDKAEEYAKRAEYFYPKNPDVEELKQMIEEQRLRDEEQSYIDSLNVGRKMVKAGNCPDAIPYYEEYLQHFQNDNVELELAEVYLCANRYKDAIAIYDSVLTEHYDMAVEKKKAKALFWSGDTAEALPLLQKLYAQDPNDMEIELYLGDAYARVHNYKMAMEIYYDLKDKAPKSYIIEQRINWLPPEYRKVGLLGKAWSILINEVFSSASVTPFASYFDDNLNFQYYYGGLTASVGILKRVGIGGVIYRGAFANLFNQVPFTVSEGKLFVYPMENLNVVLGYGKIYSQGMINQPVWDASVWYKPFKTLKGTLSYLHSDGAAILYSSELVTRRIPANNVRFTGEFQARTGLILGADYVFVWTEENTYEAVNYGNFFRGKVGKAFHPNFSAGYEYYFGDFKNASSYYYTPDNFLAHIIWGRWEMVVRNIWKFEILGKLGYIPENDYVLRELHARFRYNFWKNFYLEANAFVGSTFREEYSYSSGAFYLALGWNMY